MPWQAIHISMFVAVFWMLRQKPGFAFSKLSIYFFFLKKRNAALKVRAPLMQTNGDQLMPGLMHKPHEKVFPSQVTQSYGRAAFARCISLLSWWKISLCCLCKHLGRFWRQHGWSRQISFIVLALNIFTRFRHSNQIAQHWSQKHRAMPFLGVIGSRVGFWPLVGAHIKSFQPDVFEESPKVYRK